MFRFAVYMKGKNAKKYRHNVEYGSARWGTAKDIEPFTDPKFSENVILTKTERLMMSNRPKNPANARNKNVLVIGGSGSGKTRFWLKPNLLQMHSSYVVTDPKGSIVIECGKALQENKYNLKIFNTINFKKSMHYNPFAYIHSEKDILKLVTTLIANTKGDGKSGDEFWTKAETLLYCALVGYIHYEAPAEEQNFSTLIEFLNAMEVREDDEEFQNPVDLMFEALEKKKPNHFAVRQYKKYKLAAGETVLYGSASELRATLDYDFSQEKNYSYKGLTIDEIIHHLAVFVSRLWQIHVFGEGNTRTTAVFFIKYLRTLGFDATNDAFAENAWYFRNALVRANYNNLIKGIHETTEYLELFLRNLLCDEENELHNRSLHVSGLYQDYRKVNIEKEKVNIEEPKVNIELKKANIDVSDIYGVVLKKMPNKTVEYIQKMFEEFGTEAVFGRSDMQKITGLGATRASALLKNMLQTQIIETVTGYGKGKYRFTKRD